jgi:gas vesicle protein
MHIINESKFIWSEFQSILDQFIKNNKDYSERIERSLKEYLFPNKPGNQIQKLIQDLSDEQIEDIQEKLNNILDYFLQNDNVDLTRNFLQLDQIATDWHNSLEVNYKTERLDETPDTTVFIEYPTGWYWINLNVDYSKDEAQNMGHCGNDDGKILFSLRDQDKQSHITVSYSPSEKAVYQIKGRKNSKPKSEYHQYIIDMLLNTTYEVNLMLTGGYKPKLDFNIMDLTEEQRKSLLNKKPNFIYTNKMLKLYIKNKEWSKIISMFNNGFISKIILPKEFIIYCENNNIDLSDFIFNINLSQLNKSADNIWKYVINEYKNGNKLEIKLPKQFVYYCENNNIDLLNIITYDYWNKFNIDVSAVPTTNTIFWNKVIELNPSYIEHIKNPTEEMSLIAISKEPLLLRFIENQTEEICMTAVKKSGNALEYVKDQTEEICIEAVKYGSNVLLDVKTPTEKIYLTALENQTIFTLIKYIKNPTDEMKTISIIKEPYSIQYIEQTPELCKLADRSRAEQELKTLNNKLAPFSEHQLLDH